MNNASTFIAIFGTAFGSLGGLLGLLQFFSTRKQVNRKGDADIASVWGDLTKGALENAFNRIAEVEKENKILQQKDKAYLEICTEMIDLLVDESHKRSFNAKIDAIRRM